MISFKQQPYSNAYDILDKIHVEPFRVRKSSRYNPKDILSILLKRGEECDISWIYGT